MNIYDPESPKHASARSSGIDAAALRARTDAALAPLLEAADLRDPGRKPSNSVDLRAATLDVLRSTLSEGRAQIAALASERKTSGRTLVRVQSNLTDGIIEAAWYAIGRYVAPLSNPTAAERLSIVAVGGYGRKEMSPFSDIDLLFLTPLKRTGWAETAIETLLYLLWDLGLKVGHATRSVGDLIAMSREDLTVRTAFLESRLLHGDKATFEQARTRFQSEIVDKTKPEFIASKLEERQLRHSKEGDSRFMVEPNVKEGKGGLRDLQTLYWIAKYVYGVRRVRELVKLGVFTADEYRSFRQAETFLWKVRCNLHLIANRAEERLTFDHQMELAQRLNYVEDRNGQKGVERFMKHYFLMAKRVGDLTHIFTAHLAETHQKKPLLRLPRVRRSYGNLEGFETDGRYLKAPDDSFFADQPSRMLSVFALAERTDLDIHPRTMRMLRRDRLKVNAKLRKDSVANDAFMACLTSRKDPERILRRMNEAGILGRFVPDFGKVEGMMQFDMYHHFTVDEHTIRAIGWLSRIERGMLADEHPIATELMPKILLRRALYVAMLLHDIAKGRGGNHSLMGEKIALKIGPKLGLSKAETETVAWLVRYHLVMTHYAFKRDLSDPKTIGDFVSEVKSPERLRMLLILTVVDIRAVGPGIWNGWKGQLLRALFEPALELLLAGHSTIDRSARVAEKQDVLRAAAPKLSAAQWPPQQLDAYIADLPVSYWIAEPDEIIARNAQLARDMETQGEHMATNWQVDQTDAVTHFTVRVRDVPGLFHRLTGAFALSGANIAGAKIHTTCSGMAVDNFMLQTEEGGPFEDAGMLSRLNKRLEDCVMRDVPIRDALENKRRIGCKLDSFSVEPVVLIDNAASNRFTVLEVNALDRTGLLYRIARVLYYAKVTVHSAHVATYGERAVDVFYVTDLLGQKITNTNRIRALERRILETIRASNFAALAA